MSDQPARLRFAIIGCGRMGRLHSERIRQDGRGEVVCLYDAQRAMAQQIAETLAPQATICETFDELLARQNIDAAIICTPTTSHFEQVQACARQGWHLLCEKPLAESRERTEILVAESRRRERISMLAYQRRFWGTWRTLRREVQSGKWGAIRAVTSHNVEQWEQTIAGTWRNDPQINIGGFVGDAGNHKLDQVFFVTGLSVREVQARSLVCRSLVNIQTSVSALLGDGALLCMNFIGNAHYLSEDFHVHCDYADLMLRDRKIWIAQDNMVEQLENLEPESNPVSGFLDVVEGKLSNPAPFEIALPVWDFLSEILQSSRAART